MRTVLTLLPGQLPRIRDFEKRGAVWLDFKDLNGVRHRVPSGTSSLEEAAKNARAIVESICSKATAISVPPVQKRVIARKEVDARADLDMTLARAFERGMKVRESWLTSKNKTSLQQVYEQVAKYFGPDRALTSITRDEVLDWRSEMLNEDGQRTGSKLAASTVNHRLSMLSVLMDVADVRGHRVRHLSTRGNHRTRRITDDELAGISAWLASRDHLKGADTLKDLIEMAMATAARQGELLGLTWDDVAERAVTFRDTKNRDTRVVPLTQAARDVLKRREGTAGGPFGDVDCFRVTALWDDFREFLGLKHDHEFVFHSLRHESISRLADRGVNAFTLQRIAGHSNVETTQRYVKTSLRAMAEAMGAV